MYQCLWSQLGSLMYLWLASSLAGGWSAQDGLNQHGLSLLRKTSHPPTSRPGLGHLAAAPSSMSEHTLCKASWWQTITPAAL